MSFYLHRVQMLLTRSILKLNRYELFYQFTMQATCIIDFKRVARILPV